MISERCLRTQFISEIGAPDFRSCLVSACLASKLTPAAGADQIADAPPESRQSTRSFGPALFGEFDRAFGAGDRIGVGHRVAGLQDLDDPGRQPKAVPRRNKAGNFVGLARRDVVVFGGDGHRRRGLAGANDDNSPARWHGRQVRRQAGRRDGLSCRRLQTARSMSGERHRSSRLAFCLPGRSFAVWCGLRNRLAHVKASEAAALAALRRPVRRLCLS